VLKLSSEVSECKPLPLGHPLALDDLATVDPTLHKNQVLYVTEHGPEAGAYTRSLQSSS